MKHDINLISKSNEIQHFLTAKNFALIVRTLLVPLFGALQMDMNQHTVRSTKTDIALYKEGQRLPSFVSTLCSPGIGHARHLVRR